MNQCAFKHSARNLPLNDSMKALSVGLARTGEVQRDVAVVGPQVEVAARCYYLGRTCFDLDTARQLNDIGDELLLTASKLDGQDSSNGHVMLTQAEKSLRQSN
jgi:hypothetical protein